MLRVAIILGSSRPGRKGEPVAKWVYEIAMKRSDAEFEFVDIRDFNLPHLDEPMPASLGQYARPHTSAVRTQVALSLFTDFENFSVFQPGARQERAVQTMLDEVIGWGGALKLYREQKLEARASA
jgi:NADPH-dependent FMN reductase